MFLIAGGPSYFRHILVGYTLLENLYIKDWLSFMMHNHCYLADNHTHRPMDASESNCGLVFSPRIFGMHIRGSQGSNHQHSDQQLLCSSGGRAFVSIYYATHSFNGNDKPVKYILTSAEWLSVFFSFNAAVVSSSGPWGPSGSFNLSHKEDFIRQWLQSQHTKCDIYGFDFCT